jgi:hypothetical protein
MHPIETRLYVSRYYFWDGLKKSALNGFSFGFPCDLSSSSPRRMVVSVVLSVTNFTPLRLH